MAHRGPIVVAGLVCLDLTPALDHPASLRPGRLVTAGPMAFSAGGAVGNVGVALHRLGVPVRLAGRIGDDRFGQAVTDVLDAAGPGLADGLRSVEGETTSYTIVISAPGMDRAFLHCPGANDRFTASDVRFEEVARAPVLHFGYPPMMRGMYADGGAALHALLARAGAAGTVTSLDLCEPDPGGESGRVDWSAVLARVLGAVDVFAPSVGELRTMLDGEDAPAPPDRALAASLAERALAMGAAVVALKLGDQGLYLRTAADPARLERLTGTLGLDARAWRDREVLAPCFAPRAVANTTAAGDCTIAGLLAALLRGEDPVRAATAATAVGACSVEARDATGGIPPWSAVARRIAQGWERSPVAAGLREGADWRRDALGTLFAPAAEETP